MADKIKIVYLIDSFSFGGAEMFLYNLCQRLDREVFEIEVAAVVFGGPLEQAFKKLGLKVRVFRKKNKLGLGLLWELTKYLKASRPQIVHTNLFGADTWGRLSALLARVPLIVSTEHNINLDEPWFKKLIKRFLAGITAKIVAISEGVKDYSVKTEKIPTGKFRIIYYGLDLQKFPFKGYREIKVPGPVHAVTVARLVEQKGHKYLLEALPLILKKYPQFVLHLVGSGNLAIELKNLVQEMGLENNVVFEGEKMEIAKILAQMDLFILPSLWEGLGLVLLEAQASGVPILASEIPGVTEIIKDSQTGLLFPPQNSLAIFKQVNHLLTYPAVAEKIVNQAYQQVVENNSLGEMTGNYQNLYFQLLKKNQ